MDSSGSGSNRELELCEEANSPNEYFRLNGQRDSPRRDDGYSTSKTTGLSELDLMQQVKNSDKMKPQSRLARAGKDLLGKDIVRPSPVRCLDVDGQYYMRVVMTMVVLSSVSVGIEIANQHQWWAHYFRYVNAIFDAFFFADLFLRINEKGVYFFLEPFEWQWNWLDFLLVSFGGVERLLEASRVATDLKISELVQVVRTFRVLRLVRFFRELAIIAESFFTSLQSVSWICIMMFAVIYFCALVTTMCLGYNENATPQVRRKFGGLGSSILTLFEVTTLDGWTEITQLVTETQGWGWAFFFSGYVFLTSFTFLGLMTAVITDKTIQSMREDREFKAQELKAQRLQMQDKLRSVFAVGDSDESGTLTKQEMLTIMGNPTTVSELAAMGWTLNENDIEETFDLLDHDSSGSIECDEFLEGFMMLHGEAKAKDIFVSRVLVQHRIAKLEAVVTKQLMATPRSGEEKARLLPIQESTAGSLVGQETAEDALQAVLSRLRGPLLGDKERLRQVLAAAAESL
eukprot:TRINITY_DN14559_c0_g1_i1.p1 TRINITY_DN14559_c0_g1~~TRINITY_DN14559_c0_g1_i1.p1  ORF type:complete len:516 (-),score=104.02 TRINITY_DN14559_c0_g1_i1:21-1568(-)